MRIKYLGAAASGLFLYGWLIDKGKVWGYGICGSMRRDGDCILV